MNLYTSLLTIENINFLRELQCENLLFPDETIVCCPYNSSKYRWAKFQFTSIFHCSNFELKKNVLFEKHWRNPSVFIDLDSLPKISESEADAALNDTIFQHLSDLNEHSILNMMDVNTFIDRLDHEVDDENLLPRKFECGDGAQFVNRVFGGDFTSISEFPWYNYGYTDIHVVCFAIKFTNAQTFFSLCRMALLIYNTNSSEFHPHSCYIIQKKIIITF